MNDITLNDLIPNFRVYYKNGNEVVYRTIEYIRNPDEDKPNINVALTNLPFENNDLDKENEEKQTQNKTLMIKFIGEEDEETCNVNVNNNNVNISVIRNDFLFYDTELFINPIINFNELNPNIKVYYKDGNKNIESTIEYIRNPDEPNPNINVELTKLPFENNDLEKEHNLKYGEEQIKKKILMIKFIGKEDEETCLINLNNNNVYISVIGNDFLFYDTELYIKPIINLNSKLNLNELILNIKKVYYKNDNQEVERIIQYIRNPNESKPNINVELINLPLAEIENDNLENEEKQIPKKTLMIKFIGEEDEETCNVNVNNNDVNILVMKDDFLFYETELYKKNTQKKTGGKKRRLSRKKRRLSRKKRRLSRKRK